MIFRVVLLALTGALISCGDPDTHWKDGNYRVYSRSHSREIILGYHKGDGGVLGLSEATVTAAGADEAHVVFRIDSSEHYYIVRNSNGEGTPIGPFARAEFERLVEEGGLPAFEWHLQE